MLRISEVPGLATRPPLSLPRHRAVLSALWHRTRKLQCLHSFSSHYSGVSGDLAEQNRFVIVPGHRMRIVYFQVEVALLVLITSCSYQGFGPFHSSLSSCHSVPYISIRKSKPNSFTLRNSFISNMLLPNAADSTRVQRGDFFHWML